MEEADGWDLDHMEDPYVMLIVENPLPKEGDVVEVMPGLPGTVFMAMSEEDEKERKVTAYIKVKCEAIEAFLKGLGMKIESVNEIISGLLNKRKH